MHQIQISIYDAVAHQYLSQSTKYNAIVGQNRYSIQLPVKNDINDEYNYLLPNRQYFINIQLFNVQKKDEHLIEIVLQNVTDIYYQPHKSNHYISSINGLYFVHSNIVPFNIENNAPSMSTPFATFCIICGMLSYFLFIPNIRSMHI